MWFIPSNLPAQAHPASLASLGHSVLNSLFPRVWRTPIGCRYFRKMWISTFGFDDNDTWTARGWGHNRYNSVPMSTFPCVIIFRVRHFQFADRDVGMSFVWVVSSFLMRRDVTKMLSWVWLCFVLYYIIHTTVIYDYIYYYRHSTQIDDIHDMHWKDSTASRDINRSWKPRAKRMVSSSRWNLLTSRELDYFSLKTRDGYVLWLLSWWSSSV